MKQQKRKIKIQKEKLYKVVAIAIFAVIVMVLGGNFVMAKYYSYKAEKGISIASAFYFNSDKLITDVGSTKEEDIKGIDITKYSVISNTTRWTSGTYDFMFQIRNYDNNLLYNETGLNTKYKICFYLVGSANGVSYKVGVMNKENTAMEGEMSTLTVDSPWVSYEHTLEGGTLQANTYRIQVELTDVQTYAEDTKVLVVAYPVSEDEQINELHQNHRLVGVFQPHLSDVTMKIHNAQFLVQNETDYESKWLEKVQDLSGLIYNIKTSGDALVDASNAVKKIVVVKWKSEYLSISEYEQNYITARQKDTETNAVSEPEDNENEWVWTETVDGVNWTCMKLEMPPYSSIDLSFYKTDKFMTECVASGAMDKAAFEGLVKAYIPGASTDVTP